MILRLISKRSLLAATLALSLFAVTTNAAQGKADAPAGRGTVSVTVTNADTQQLLEGARVEVVGKRIEAYTDELGVAVLDRVPAGNVEIRISYTGLEPETQSLEVYAGDHATLSVDMRAEIYKLAAFAVTGEREGNAASITSQRNSPNVKTVISMDAFGELSNQNPAEVLIRLPGVTPIVSEDGEIFSVNIRGIAPALNTVTIDGTKAASNAALSRDFRFATVPAGLFSEMEVAKALTPDMAPDSLGAAVNMKTKNALKMKGGAEFTYRAAAKWVPSFLDYSPRRVKNRLSPQFQFGYRQLIDAFGGKRNLGVTLGLSHVLNRGGLSSTAMDYEYTTNDPAYIYRYQTRDTLSDSERKAGNLRIDYKLNNSFRIWITGMLNSQYEKRDPLMAPYRTDANASRTVATVDPVTGAVSVGGVILPGYTGDFTEVRGINNGSNDLSTFTITHGENGFLDKQHRLQFGAELKLLGWTLDAVAGYSESKVYLDGGDHHNYSSLQMIGRVYGAGWTLDKSESGQFPILTQTTGPDISDLSNYKDGELRKYYGGRDSSVQTAAINARRIFRLGLPVEIKAGGLWQRQKMAETGGETRWWYAGPDGVRGTGDEDLGVFADPHFKRDLRFNDAATPAFDMVAIGNSLVNDRTRWIEDVYYKLSETLNSTRDITEDIQAAYLMGKTVAGPFSILAGVRMEWTELTGRGYAKVAARGNVVDPYERIRLEYTDLLTQDGEYSHIFPSVHLKYAITRRLLARASWSTAIGRPAPGELVPNRSPNNSEQSLTINNPNLKPQYANNFDIVLEYYFEPVGVIGIGAFRKNITDFIYRDAGQTVGTGPDNGYDGLYGGYELRQNMNGGRAHINGLEFSWQQQLSIISDALKGLSVSANYTYLETGGDYGDGLDRRTGDVAGFVPRAANVDLRYNYRAFSLRLSMVYAGSYLNSYSATDYRKQYRRARTAWNAGITWRFSQQFRVFIDCNNIFDAPTENYRGKSNRPNGTSFSGPYVSFGIHGLF